MLLDPATLPQSDRYKLLIGGIVPRPIAVVSTTSPDGKHNVAPFSFFTGVSSNPLSLLFCPANNNDGSEKDTLRNCRPRTIHGSEAPGDFVVNILSHAHAKAMAATAEALPYGESEFALSGLTPAPCTRVRAPRIAEAVVSYECRTSQIITLGSSTNAPNTTHMPAGGNIVIGEILLVHVQDDAINDRYHIDPAIVDAIGRLGGLTYCTTRDRFDMPPGKKALASRE